MPALIHHIEAALPADAAAAIAATCGETPARVAAMLAGAVPLLAAALPSAATSGLAALLTAEAQLDHDAARELLAQLFGTDVDAMARSLAGSARSTRPAALAVLAAAVAPLALGVRDALGRATFEPSAVVALAVAGRPQALAAIPPELATVTASFAGLSRRLTPPRAPRRAKDGSSGNWILALMRRINRDQSRPR